MHAPTGAPSAAVTTSGRFLRADDTFAHLLGVTPDDLPGHQLDAYGDQPIDAASILDCLGATTDGSAGHVRVVLRSPGGDTLHAHLITYRAGDDVAVILIDETRRALDEEELTASNKMLKFFDVVTERSREFITVHGPGGETIYASPAGLTLFGPHYDRPTYAQTAIIHPDDRPGLATAWAHMLTRSESHTWRYRAQSEAGDWFWIEQTSTNLLDTEIGGIVSSFRDVTTEVTATLALSASEAQYRTMAETAEEGIVLVSSTGHVTYANARISSIFGLTHEQVIGVPVWSVLEGQAKAEVSARVGARTVLDRPERYEVPYRHPDGIWRTLWVAASAMPDADGVHRGAALAMISDITDIRRNESELRHAAQHDHLTGLPNRTTLMKHLESLDLPDVAGTAVLFVDLDHFKDVNDGRGHTAGDMVLIEVADRLLSAVGTAGMVARFGGDEFVIVLRDVDEWGATNVAKHVLESLSSTYDVGHHTIGIGATIGIALSPAPSAEDLLRFSDTAMYAAKAGGRGRVRLFDRALAQQAEERYVLGAELLTALGSDGLSMKYQPVVDVSTGEVVGVEALARWHHPTYGEVSPARFVALAELSASSVDLDRWVIRRALRDVGELKADLTMPDDAYVSINLSGQSLSDEGLGRYIVSCVEAAGLEPGTVMLEITESAIMTDKDIAIDVLKGLRDRGFDIAIDDFGTGYSSMAYLRDLPLTVLKIDRGFIRGIPEDVHSLAIVTSLIELATSLELTVVAEGVETQEHLDALRTRGCGLAQGWLWSPALSVEQLRSSKILTDRFAADDVWPVVH